MKIDFVAESTAAERALKKSYLSPGAKACPASKGAPSYKSAIALWIRPNIFAILPSLRIGKCKKSDADANEMASMLFLRLTSACPFASQPLCSLELGEQTEKSGAASSND